MNLNDGADLIHVRLGDCKNLQDLRETLDALVSLFARSDEVSSAAELCRDALRRADELDLHAADWLYYASRLLESLRRRGAVREALDLIDGVLQHAALKTISPVQQIGAFLVVASVLREAGDIDRAAEILTLAAPKVCEAKDTRSTINYHFALGHIFARRRQFNRAIAAYNTAASLSLLLGDISNSVRASGDVARTHMAAGRLRVAKELFNDIAQADAVGPKQRITTACNDAICLVLLGDWGDAECRLTSASAVAGSLGLSSDLSRIESITCLLAIRRGDLEAADSHASRALRIARENGLVREELAALECLGEIAYERGKPAEAIERYAECIARGEKIGMTDATTEGKRREAEAWNSLGEYEKALAAARRCQDVARHNEDRYEHAVVHRPLAMAHSMLGAREDAEQTFRRGIEEMRELGDRYELAKTLVEFACHLRDSDPSTLTLGAAGEHLREARDHFADLGVTRWIERVDQELGEVMRLTEPDAPDPGVQRTATPAIERGVHSIGSVSIITRSREMHEMLERLARVAPSSLPILITGESGTGKELVARAVQELSGRPADRFIAVNCAALPKELHESELFGHVKGSFTGATSEKPGLFEQADGGTIFLDEIGDLDLGAQGKLLRVLENGELRRVGELKSRRVDARVVAATNRDLEQAARDDSFRSDLYHRLNGLWVRIPALRERIEDIEVLVLHYLEQYQRQYGKRADVSADLLSLYKSYSWPGNVRELRQEVHRMVLLSHDRETMRVEDSQIARSAGAERSGAAAQASGYASAIDDHERRLIVDALQKTAGNKARAARLLNMSRTTLLGKIRRLGID